MKTEIKKALFLLFISFVYILQAMEKGYTFDCIYLFGFIIAVVILYVIKNKYIVFLFGITVPIALWLYNADYAYLSGIAFLLICAHKNLIPTKKNDGKSKNETDIFSFLFLQLAIFSSIALFIYSLITIENRVKYATANFNRVILIYTWLIGVFLYSLYLNRSTKKSAQKISKQLSGSLRFMYIVSIIGFSATVLFSYTKIGISDMTYKAMFFPWFIYICSMVYNGDPYIESFTENIEKILIKISNKNKVK